MRRKGRRNQRRRFKPRARRKRPQSLFYKLRRFALRHPLVSGVGSIVLSIILFRISMGSLLFGNDVTEFRLWFMLAALIIGIVGLFSLVAWWRNNVSMRTTKHNVTWKNR